MNNPIRTLIIAAHLSLWKVMMRGWAVTERTVTKVYAGHLLFMFVLIYFVFFLSPSGYFSWAVGSFCFLLLLALCAVSVAITTNKCRLFCDRLRHGANSDKALYNRVLYAWILFSTVAVFGWIQSAHTIEYFMCAMLILSGVCYSHATVGLTLIGKPPKQ